MCSPAHTGEGKTLEEGDYLLVQAWDRDGEPLFRRKVVQRGEHWEDGERRREADWRIPAPAASPHSASSCICSDKIEQLSRTLPHRWVPINCCPAEERC